MSSPNPSNVRSSLRSRLLRKGPFLLIFGYVVALLYRLVLFSGSLYWGDIFLYFLPMQEYVQSSLRQGYLPLWNPYVLCGQPLVGNPQSWVIYPSTAFINLVPVWSYLTLNYLLHLAFAGLGTYLFARRLCGDRTCGILAAVTFVGSGFFFARLQFPTMVQAAAYLPWILLLSDRLIERPGIGYASLLGLVVGLQVLSGHPQLAYISFFTATIYFFVRLFQARKHRARARSAFLLGILALLIGIVLTAAQLLPTLELFRLSTREQLTWSQANRFVIRPSDLIHYLAPYWHGNPADGNFWGVGNLWESCVYVGIAPLVLAIFVVLRRFRRRAVAFFGLLALGSLWLALGRFGGLFFLAFYVVPGLASFHDPARFTFITTFALSILAALGLRALRDRGWSSVARAAVTAVAALNLWAFSAHVNPVLAREAIPAAFGYRPRYMASAPAAGEGRVFTAERDRVWQRYLNYSDYGPDSARYTHELTDTVSPNIGMRFGVEEASGYEPVPIKAVTEIDSLVRASMERKAPNLTSLLQLFNATAVLLPEMTRFRHPALDDLPARGTSVFELRDILPRAWLVRRTFRVDGDKRSLAAISSPDFDPRTSAIVSDGAGIPDLPNAGPAAPVRFESVRAGRISLLADAGTQKAYLVTSETWFPGWKATIDSRPATIERANHAFRGIAIPPGLHRVEMRFAPSSFQVGLYITLCAASMVAAGMTYGVMMRRISRAVAVTTGQARAAAKRGNSTVEV